MKEIIQNKINQYVLENEDNYFEEIHDYYYDAPIIKYAASNDPLFAEYKSIIGNEHFTPAEAFDMSFGKDSYHGGTVISIALPVNQKIVKSNRAQKEWPSREWVLLRSFADEIFLKNLMKYTETFLNEMGYKTIAPWASDWFKVTPGGFGVVSSWSERHIAYAAGHGSFGLNSGLITEKGIAVKFISVVTELNLSADTRTAKTVTENCLYYNKGTCGVCIKRCPVNAIRKNGFDRMKCMRHMNSLESKQLIASCGGNTKANTGCGLCRTNVPCESQNPMTQSNR